MRRVVLYKTSVQRYTRQLSDQENRLQGIETETADFQKKRDAAQSELDQMIEALSFDLTP